MIRTATLPRYRLGLEQDVGTLKPPNQLGLALSGEFGRIPCALLKSHAWIDFASVAAKDDRRLRRAASARKACVAVSASPGSNQTCLYYQQLSVTHRFTARTRRACGVSPSVSGQRAGCITKCEWECRSRSRPTPADKPRLQIGRHSALSASREMIRCVRLRYRLPLLGLPETRRDPRSLNHPVEEACHLRLEGSHLWRLA